MSGTLPQISLDSLKVIKPLSWVNSGNPFYEAAYLAKYQGEKVMLLQMSGDSNVRRSLQKHTGELFGELKIECNRLDHPNVLKTFGLAKISAEVYYLVVEYVGQVTLSEYLQTHSLSAKNVMKMGGKIANGLAYLHSKGIIHSDIATCNVFLDKKNNPKLFNFAMSKQLTEPKILTESCGIGHERSLSPETYLHNTVSIKSDVWQLGTLMSEMITKEQPFSVMRYNREVFDNMMRRNDVQIPRSNMPEVLYELIQRCCCFDQDNRLSADAVKAFCQIKHNL